MIRVYVELILDADCNAEAADGTNEILRDQQRKFVESSCLRDYGIAALDTLTKANEELRAEVERLKLMEADWKGLIDRLTKERDDAVEGRAFSRAWANRLTKERDEARAWHQASQEALADQLEARTKAEDQADKFKWQVRDTCTRAEKAEARLSAMQEAIDEAVRTLRISQGRLALTGILERVRDAISLLKPFATKPEPEVDPLVDGREYVIRKGGYFYRPNASGYTTDLEQAGLYTLDEAVRHSHPNGPDGPRDGMSYHKIAARGGRVVLDGREG